MSSAPPENDLNATLEGLDRVERCGAGWPSACYRALFATVIATIPCCVAGGSGGGGGGGFVANPGPDVTTGTPTADTAAASPDGCTPKCGTKNCGSNGCGGECGSCSGPTPVCSASGTCISADCKPNCDGKACNDGCGGKCENSPCDDNSVCTKEETCSGGICVGAPALECDDSNPCTVDACSPTKGCVSGPNASAACSDGNACTLGDSCEGSKCLGSSSISCDDKDSCTTDSCDPKAGCIHAGVPNLTACAGVGLCVSGNCCVCGPGQACNLLGKCVSDTSCEGKCGSYAKDTKCQCDAECEKYKDCCADKATVCSGCVAKASKACCGADKLCTADSCGKKDGEEVCAFGCDAKTAKCKSDPCNGVPVSGVCATPGMVAFCSVATGDGAPPELDFTFCGKTETCDETFGFAFCKQDPNKCTPGEVTCVAGKPDVMLECSDAGVVKEVTCAKCKPTTLPGAVVCPGNLQIAPVFGFAKFEGVEPKKGYTGYDEAAPEVYKAIHTFVVSVRYSSDFLSGTVLDLTTTDGDGKFIVNIPKEPNSATDYIVLAAAGIDAQSKEIRYAVLKPSVAKGEQSQNQELGGKVHSWMIESSWFVDNDDWVISLEEQSFALQVYDAIRYTYENAKAGMFGTAGKSVAVWVAEGTDWKCGACFNAKPTTTAPLPGKKDAESQVWIGSSDKAYWSDAVLYHEFGHWLMSAYGTPPGEGGPHVLNSKVPPGMAWSEGWATFFSSAARGNPVYYDMGGGGMWWFDLSKAQYDTGGPLKPFSAMNLHQFMDENRVSAALWNSAEQGQEPLKAPANAPFWAALAAPQMKDGKFTRGYFKQVLGKLVEGGPDGASYPDIKSTNTPAPMLADYLDALLCKAPNLAPKVKQAIGLYPFPVNNPICKP